MTTKVATDTISVLIVPAANLKTQKAFRAAVNAALPDVGSWEYQDYRKAFGYFEVHFHPRIEAKWGNGRVSEAKSWLESRMPQFEVSGLRVIQASVIDRELINGVSKVYRSVYSTKEYYELQGAVMKRE
jgi:hypothetical protein